MLPPASSPWFHAVREAVAAHGRLGHINVVETWARESARAIPAAGAEGAQIASLAPAAVHMLYAGREAIAADLIARVEALLANAPDVELVLVARVHQMRAIAAAHRKDSEGEVAEQRAALATFEKAGDQRNASLTRANMGYAIAQLGMFEAAQEALERRAPPPIASASRRSGRWRCTTSGSSTRTSGASTRPRTSSSAPSILSRARPILGSRAPRGSISRGILFAAGDVAGAEREARAAFAATAHHGASKVGALAALARALLAQGDLEGARAAARDTEALLAQPAIEEWEGYARITVVEVLEAAGEHALARSALERALASIAVRASRLRDPATIASLLGRIPEHARAIALAAAWGVELPEPLRREPAA